MPASSAYISGHHQIFYVFARINFEHVCQLDYHLSILKNIFVRQCSKAKFTLEWQYSFIYLKGGLCFV